MPSAASDADVKRALSEILDDTSPQVNLRSTLSQLTTSNVETVDGETLTVWRSPAFQAEVAYYSSDLGVWGWIWLISGIIILAAGIGLFYRRGWAWLVGMLAGVFGLIVNLFWLFAEPVSALVGVILSTLVIYGLSRYDENELEY